MLPEIQVLDESPDKCTAVIGGSKVALLFLTRGDLHHDPSWRLWFQSAAGILPLHVISPRLCSRDSQQLEQARAVCMPTTSSTSNSSSTSHGVVVDDPILHQHLFNVYVHLSTDVDKAVLGPLWQSRIVEHRVATEWGTHSLIEATRSLLWEAFKDPSNQRFILVSETDVPIWDPLTLYHEVMAETRSRVDAWWHPDMHTGRWSWRMALSGARIKKSDWRKSAQWFSMIRSHVEVVLRDEAVFAAFETYCKSAFDSDYGKWRECFSDEHYLPTLLNMKGLVEETVPSPLGITTADWSEGSAHPHEFTPEEVTPELFTTRLRNNSECPSVGTQHMAVQEAARRNFVSIVALLQASSTGDSVRTALCNNFVDAEHKKHEENNSNSNLDGIDSNVGGDVGDGSATKPSFVLTSSQYVDGDGAAWSQKRARPSLPSGCSLLARKFPSSTVEAVLQVFRNCSSGIQLIGDGACQRLHQDNKPT